MARRLLGSATTNSNGVATFNYTNAYVGKVDVIAVTTVDGTTVSSDTQEIYDTIWYDVATDSQHREDYSNSGLTVRYESDGTILENTSSSGYNYTLNTSINQDMIIEFDITPLVANGSGNIRFYICGGDCYITSYVSTLNTKYHIKFVCENGVIKLFVDGTETTYTRNMTSNTNTRFILNNRTIKFSNLIIYSL